MNQNPDPYQYNQNDGLTLREPISTYTAKTFGWMFLGLVTTFFLAIASLLTGVTEFLFYHPALCFGLPIAEVVVVLVLASRVQKLKIGTARALFFGYAALTGISFGSLFILYDVGVLIMVFGMCALYFGLMALYGWKTKADLTRIRSVLIGGLIFLVIFDVILGLFFNFTTFETGICTIGMVIFLGFTAYDTQMVRNYYYAYADHPEMLKKVSIISALQLYLDFINLFLYLLRLFGNRD